MKSTWNWMYYCKWADPRSASPLSYSLSFICTNCFELCICVVWLYRLHCSSCSCSSRRSPSRSCWSATRRLEQWTRSQLTRASPGSRTRAASGWPGAWSSPGTAPGSCPHHTWPVDNSFVSVLFSFSPYLPGVAGQVAPHRVAVNVSPPRAGVRVALQRRTLCYHLHCCDAHRAWTHCQGTSSPGLNMCCGSCILPACKHNLNI